MENSDYSQEKWESIVSMLSQKFADGEKLDLDGVLYLLGVRELGGPVRKFKKDEKLDIFHIAICRVLSPWGYYRLIGLDQDGWPQYEKVSNLPPLKAGEQATLMKMAIIRYFDEEGIAY